YSELAAAFRYDSFGQMTTTYVVPTYIEQPYTYTGRQLDSESGLMYLRARYYDPRVGRFASEDPADPIPNESSYKYVLNSPTNLFDPYGLRELGTVRCHAECSGLYSDVDDDVPEILKPCVEAHEQNHIDWMLANYWPDACCQSKGCVPEGTQAVIPKDRQNEVECAGYRAEKDCLHDLRSAADWQAIRKRETEVDSMIRRYCRDK
ncbi:MAG: RHS repeat-associated core domain-containing protein, partial [Thermodesulfobacteriota bacterium]